MEQVYDPEFWDTTTDEEKLAKAIAVFEEITWDQRKQFLINTRQTRVDQPMGDDYAARIELGKGMLRHYVLTVHPEADKIWRPVKVEVPFSVPLYYPSDHEDAGEIMECMNAPDCGQEHPNPAPVTLNGRVDAIFEDIINGGYYIIDWKTAASLITDGEFLQLDDQITSYCAALGHVLGIDVRGFLYSEIRKDYPKPPKKLMRTTRGVNFSTAVDQPTTYEIAKATFEKEDGPGYRAGFYNTYLQKLRDDPPKFHQRFPIIQSQAKLENTLENVAMEAMDIIGPHLRLYPSPSKQNCQGCVFKGPCLGKYNDEDYQYTLKTLFGRK